MIQRDPLYSIHASGLARALERRELLLHFQPEVDARTGRLVCAEALVRWKHPERGLVPPMDFIPLAEETGLIVGIGDWVLRAACRQARAWLSATPPLRLRVAVNLSARQLGEDRFVQRVEDALDESGLDAASLELEITESAVAREPARAARTLAALRLMGVRLMIDDFGTGYSSLSQLKNFPVDGLKIDRAFVRHLPHDRSDATITRAVLAMAREMSLDVVAEGVEHDEQRAFLSRHGCGLLQGYLFGAPMPADRFRTLFGEAARAAAPRRAPLSP